MINKEDIKAGDLVKGIHKYNDKMSVFMVERVNQLSFRIKGAWYPVKFSESQSYYKMTDEEIKKYYDEEFEELCRKNNQYASKYLDKLEHINKLLRELSKEEHITYTINIDDVLEGIEKEILKIDSRWEENKNEGNN